MDYDTSLITGAELVELTGVTDLASLATDGELVLNTAALNAHREVYARLEGQGVDPTLLTNESRLRHPVAFLCVANLAAANQLGSISPQAFYDRVDAAIGSDGRSGYFRPVYASADSPRRSNEGIPVVGHLGGSTVFSGDLETEPTRYFSDGTPTSY